MVALDHHFRKLAVFEFERDAPWKLDRNAPIIASVAPQFMQSDAGRFPLYPQVIECGSCVHDCEQCFGSDPKVSGQRLGLISRPDIFRNFAPETDDHFILHYSV